MDFSNRAKRGRSGASLGCQVRKRNGHIYFSTLFYKNGHHLYKRGELANKAKQPKVARWFGGLNLHGLHQDNPKVGRWKAGLGGDFSAATQSCTLVWGVNLHGFHQDNPKVGRWKAGLGGDFSAATQSCTLVWGVNLHGFHQDNPKVERWKAGLGVDFSAAT